MLMSEKLQNVLEKTKGWRAEIPLTVRADALYWLAHLVEAGIERKRDIFRKTNWDACAIASLGSWQMNLEALVEQAIRNLEAKGTLSKEVK